MAIAKKCDICGVYYDSYNEHYNKEKTNGFMFLNIDIHGKYYAGNPTDCCPKCMEAIRNYIKSLDRK